MKPSHLGSKHLLHLREPHSPVKAVLILYAVIHDREALLLKQLAVLGGIEARMVKRLSFQLARRSLRAMVRR
jgi:hypothetical protein